MVNYEEPNMEILMIEGQVIVEISNGIVGGEDGEDEPWA